MLHFTVNLRKIFNSVGFNKILEIQLELYFTQISWMLIGQIECLTYYNIKKLSHFFFQIKSQITILLFSK